MRGKLGRFPLRCAKGLAECVTPWSGSGDGRRSERRDCIEKSVFQWRVRIGLMGDGMIDWLRRSTYVVDAVFVLLLLVGWVDEEHVC